MSDRPAYVYLLRCGDGSLYCGWTIDVPRRLHAHAAGRASRYTASRAPVSLAAAWEVPSRTHARRLEARIKRLPRPQKLALAAGAPLEDATPVRFALLPP
jgi:putative endonuclease